MRVVAIKGRPIDVNGKPFLELQLAVKTSASGPLEDLVLRFDFGQAAVLREGIAQLPLPEEGSGPSTLQ